MLKHLKFLLWIVGIGDSLWVIYRVTRAGRIHLPDYTPFIVLFMIISLLLLSCEEGWIRGGWSLETDEQQREIDAVMEHHKKRKNIWWE